MFVADPFCIFVSRKVLVANETSKLAKPGLKLAAAYSFEEIVLLFGLFVFASVNECVVFAQDNDESLSQKSDSPSSIETDSGVSLTSSENDAGNEDDLNEVSMDVSEKSSAACANFDGAEESESIQGLKGPEVFMQF